MQDNKIKIYIYVCVCVCVQLQQELLLCPGQRVMLTCNLWVEAGLVNGALGTVQNIFFSDVSKPPQLPMYATVSFDDYIGLPWDIRYPKLFQ